MKFLKRISHITVLFICCQSPFVFAGDDTYVDLDATLGLDNNVTRANYKSDIERDSFLSLEANFNSEIFRGRSSLLTAHALLAAEQFRTFRGLSNYSAGADATYTFAFSDGFGAPWFAVNASYRVTQFDSTLRDSNFAAGKLTMGKRIDDLTDMRVGVGAQSRNSDSLVFDNRNTFGFANLDLTVGTRQTVYLTYRVQKGDTFSTSSDSNISLAVIDAAGAANQPDDVFIGKRSYRLDATTQMFTIGYNHGLDELRSYDLSVRYLRSKTNVDLEYQDITVRAGYFQRIGIDL
jgi:hypothetical protein